jgi:hypothetical protein
MMDEGLNSGVQIRSKSTVEFQNGRVHGMQVECEDSQRGWTGGLFDEARKGWRYPLEYNSKAKSASKKGQWNKFKVIAYQNHIISWVNGIACANLIEEEVETGFIALQVHGIHNKAHEGKKIRWRNINISGISKKDFESLGAIDAPEVSYLKNELTQAETEKGWKLLWDGKTTNGWRGSKLKSWNCNKNTDTKIVCIKAETPE